MQRRTSPHAWRREYHSGPDQMRAPLNQTNDPDFVTSAPFADIAREVLPRNSVRLRGRNGEWHALRSETEHDTRDEASVFARAFEEAEQEAQASLMQAENQAVLDMLPSEPDTIEDLVKDPSELMHQRIGSDRIQAENQNNNYEDNTDELARTAGQLLDSVRGDTSKKFQESSFLALMRQLRDREVKLEGEKFIDVWSPFPSRSTAWKDSLSPVSGRKLICAVGNTSSAPWRSQLSS